MFKPQPLIFDPKVSTSPIIPARHHNYAVGGNLVNAFATGPIGAEDDFWLLALEPPNAEGLAVGPLICANILDAFGRRLLTLERNAPTFNPRGCRVEAAGGRLDVTDARGRGVFHIDVREVRAAECLVSYISGYFKDKNGAVRMDTRGPEANPSVVLQGRHGLGLRPDGSIALNKGLTDEEVARVAAMAQAQ